MKSLTILIVVGAFLWAVAGAVAEDPAIDTSARIADLNLGEYWYGAQITHEDLVGKVVLFEIWGS